MDCFRNITHSNKKVWRGLCLLLALSILSILSASAQETPQKGIVRGNPKAIKGGIRRTRFPVPPAQLHPLNATGAYGNQVLDRIYETLAETDVDQLVFMPLLAKYWEQSKDKLAFTFYLNPKAMWQDGKPVTAQDVLFSYEVLSNPKLKTYAKWQAYLGNIARAKAINAHTITFYVKKDHFRNFINLASLRIVPKHLFTGDDPNDTPLEKHPIGSGAIRFLKWKSNAIFLQRNDDYWGKNLPQNVGRYNQKLHLSKVIQNDTVALESFKKEDVDLLALSPEQWVKSTTDPRFGLGAKSGKPLIKLQIKNLTPKGYSYVGWNLESPLFKDVRVRQAMSHLFDRNTFIEKFYYNLRRKAVGPFAADSSYSSPKVKPVEFSLDKALALLRAAGWKDSDGDQLLDKQGKPFRFAILTADPDTSVKILTLTKQTMKQVGIDLEIKLVDWSTLLKLIDEYQYDAVMLGWSRSLWPDPTALWHSRSAVKGGLNLVRYRNKQVDVMIDKAIRSIPQQQRTRLYRRIHEQIAADQPYTFLLESSMQLMVYQSRFKQQQPWYRYEVGTSYWWIDSPKYQ